MLLAATGMSSVVHGAAPAAMPPVESTAVMKGDLPFPLACFGKRADAEAAECMGLAFEVPPVPSIVVETRAGSTSTLIRMDATTIADGIPDESAAPRE